MKNSINSITNITSATRKEANDPKCVAEGFDINRTIHDTLLMAYELFNDDGTPKKKMRSDLRQGITGIPMESGDLEINANLPILHAYIHVLKHFENIAYTYNARHIFEDPDNPKQGMGSKKTQDEKDAVLAAKYEFMNSAKGGCTM